MEKRMTVLRAGDIIAHNRISDCINELFGMQYRGWMKGSWTTKNKNFTAWFPKLSEVKNGILMSSVNEGYLLTLSTDWNTLVFEDPHEYAPYMVPDHSGSGNDERILVFAKWPGEDLHIFTGVYRFDGSASTAGRRVHTRFATEARLIGYPVDDFEALDQVKY